MTKEPLVSTAVVTSVLGAVLALLHSFGVPLTNEQQAAISGLALVVAPLVVALVVRPKVTPVVAGGRHEAGVTVIELCYVVITACVVVLALVALFGPPAW